MNDVSGDIAAPGDVTAVAGQITVGTVGGNLKSNKGTSNMNNPRRKPANAISGNDINVTTARKGKTVNKNFILGI